ncbi:DUF2744 domain-containing protein [Nocardia elegans]|uniref:DUF2744 domain-containing protein n=1 Tax=Nocardia elegans TaxID=300029 RepID=A0ABW6TLP6_9NOCA
MTTVTIETPDGPIEVDTSPWLKEGEFPTKANTNPNCPEEALLHTYTGLPGMKGAPLAFPVEYLRMVSRRQWDCGVRPADSVIPPEVKIKYQKPRQTDPHWLTSPGVWVPESDPDREQFDIKEFVGSLPRDAKRQLAEALGFDPEGAVPDQQLVAGLENKPQQPRPQGNVVRDGATVSNEPLPFDPLTHDVRDVLAYLRDADPEEQDRVVAIERHLNDKPRAGILKRYKEVGL